MGNIPSLNILSNDTIADVPPLNENFEKLRVEVNDNDNRITNLKAQTNTSLTSIQNQMAKDKEELLEEISTTGSTKLDLDLNNVSDEGLQNIYSSLAMNTNAGVSVSSGWTATQNGWLYYYIYSDAGSTTQVYIDGKQVARNHQNSGDGRAGALRIGGTFFIAKGQTMTSSRSADFVFYPCIGKTEV